MRTTHLHVYFCRALRVTGHFGLTFLGPKCPVSAINNDRRCMTTSRRSCFIQSSFSAPAAPRPSLMSHLYAAAAARISASSVYLSTGNGALRMSSHRTIFRSCAVTVVDSYSLYRLGDATGFRCSVTSGLLRRGKAETLAAITVSDVISLLEAIVCSRSAVRTATELVSPYSTQPVAERGGVEDGQPRAAIRRGRKDGGDNGKKWGRT